MSIEACATYNGIDELLVVSLDLVEAADLTS